MPPAGACAVVRRNDEGSCTVSAPHSHKCSAAGFFSGLGKKLRDKEGSEKRRERERSARQQRVKSKGTPKPPDQTRDAHCWKHLHAPHCVEFFALRFNPYSEWCHKTVVSVDSSFQGEWGPCSLAAAARRRHTMAAAGDATMTSHRWLCGRRPPSDRDNYLVLPASRNTAQTRVKHDFLITRRRGAAGHDERHDDAKKNKSRGAHASDLVSDGHFFGPRPRLWVCFSAESGSYDGSYL